MTTLDDNCSLKPDSLILHKASSDITLQKLILFCEKSAILSMTKCNKLMHSVILSISAKTVGLNYSSLPALLKK